MGIIIWLIVGGVIGWIASMIMKTDGQQGIILNVIVGIIGAFLGGWLSPVGFLPDGFHWLALKTAAMLFVFLWARATFPRFRYDQIMRLGWKVFIPVTLVWVFVVAAWLMSPLSIWS